MIAGIVAAQALGAGGVAAFVPAGALIHLDFVNGQYWDGGLAFAADVINHPALVTPGTGLELRFADETNPGDAVTDIIGNALTALLTADWTVVIEWEQIASDQDPMLLELDNSPADGNTIIVGRDGGFPLVEDAMPGPGGRDASPGTDTPVGIHRIAVTRTDARLATSIDGDTVTFDSSALSGITLATAALGGQSGGFLFGETNIRSLTLYAPQADAALPALSA